MRSVPVSKARLGEIVESVVESRQPVRLTSHNFSAVVVGWEEWHAIEETMYRLSEPALGPTPRGRRAQTGEQVRG